MQKSLINKEAGKLNRKYLLRIGLSCSVFILVIKLSNTLVVYHFFTFDKYLAVVAVLFLLAGHFLFPRKLSYVITSPDTTLPGITGEIEEHLEELKAIRYSLTNRELVIFRYVAEGKTNKEISSILGVQVSTIKTHINNLFSKIGCKNRKEAIEKWDQMIKNHVIS